ncbi:COMM domain-containing protein 5 [Tetranychus urticae]|nr:COMM domain-containing protein 5 [Tetranychus urticae]
MSNFDLPLLRNRETAKCVRNSLKSAQQLSQSSFQQLIKAVIDYLCAGSPLDENLPVLSELNLQNTESKLLVQNLVILVRNCMRYRSTNRQISLTDILTEELRIPSKLSQIIQNEIDSAKMTATIPYGPKLPTCTSIKWRIDVVISSSSLSKVLEPLIIFEIHTDSGEKLRFDCSLTKFNQLRLAVASSLSELHRLEEKKKLYPSLRANSIR